MDESERSFTVDASSFNENGGRYVAASHRTAAFHAAKIQFKANDKSHSVLVAMRETTRMRPGLGRGMGKGAVKYYRITRHLRTGGDTTAAFKQGNGKQLVIRAKYEYRAKSLNEAEFTRDLRR
jgi:hypothetical protein